MDNFINLYPFALLLGTLMLSLRRLLTLLRYFQQEEYDNRRFIGWCFKNRLIDRRLTLTLLAVLGLLLPGVISAPIAGWLAAALLAIAALREPDPRRIGKKKLAMTARVKRIYTLTILFVAADAGFSILGYNAPLWPVLVSLILLVQLLPLYLVVANLALWPYERWTQNRFWREAHNKLMRLCPVVIGITGSFGKTSTKHILGHVLGTLAPTLYTPGSINTPMGVTRVIREQLKPEHRYFIVEMGAYGPGSITRLCRLAPPDMALITTIGHAHYERFRSLDTVADAKFELADAVLKNGGHILYGAHLQKFAPVQARLANDGNFIAVGMDGDAHIEKAEQTRKGLKISLVYKGQKHTLEAPLFGLHHAENVALAFVAALNLGFDAQLVQDALKSTPQIPHRLEVKPQSDGTTLIDDAYNSNPVGFASALELLDTLRTNDDRRIVVTPGMVELGTEHDTQHAIIGKKAAQHADLMIVVAPHRVPSLVSTFRELAGDSRLVEVPTFAAAREWINTYKLHGDIILLENDLPDLMEDKPRF